jgi:hypothetical protein
MICTLISKNIKLVYGGHANIVTRDKWVGSSAGVTIVNKTVRQWRVVRCDISQNAQFFTFITSVLNVFSREARKIWRFLDGLKQKHA